MQNKPVEKYLSKIPLGGTVLYHIGKVRNIKKCKGTVIPSLLN